MSMIRKCNNPEPSCGGNECVGSNSFPLHTPCNEFCCPGKIMIRIIFYVSLIVCSFLMTLEYDKDMIST